MSIYTPIVWLMDSKMKIIALMLLAALAYFIGFYPILIIFVFISHLSATVSASKYVGKRPVFLPIVVIMITAFVSFFTMLFNLFGSPEKFWTAYVVSLIIYGVACAYAHIAPFHRVGKFIRDKDREARNPPEKKTEKQTDEKSG